MRIESFKQEIDHNRNVIKRQDKLIVDLQQRNEVQDNAINDTRKKVTDREKQIIKLNMKNNELQGRKNTYIQDMGTLDLKQKWLKNRQDALTDLVLDCMNEGVHNLGGSDERHKSLTDMARREHKQREREQKEREREE